MKRLLLFGFVLVVSTAWSQTVTLLKDINTATNASSSNPSNFIKNAANTVFFTATDLEHGTELWKTNGTDAGTVVVKDINPGSGSSSPANFVVIGNEVYFTANDGINGTELWRSDGTSGGTYILEDINIGPGSSSPLELEVSGSTLYFSASTDSYGRELWKSGTAINTAQQIIDIEVGIGSSSPSQITNANGIIYFTAFRSADGRELWRYTGALPIGPIEDITSGSGSTSISGITAVNATSSTTIVFSASTTANGTELWRSSGTASGTYVIDIANFSITLPPTLGGGTITDLDNSSSPADFVSRSGVVYFAATDYDGERGLYSTTGASSSDYDRRDALGDLNPEDMVVCSTGVVFFSGTDSGGDRELYRLSGSSVSLVENISSSGSSIPQNLIVPETGSFVYFTATSTSFGRELYTSTTSDATRISDISVGVDDSSPTGLLYLAGVYMAGLHGTTGKELYFYNGTNTLLVKDINGGSEDSNPGTFLNTGAKLFFSAIDAGGQELWTSDGVSTGPGLSPNTLRMADIFVGATSSSAFPIAMAGSTLLFSANDGTNGTEIYSSTGAVGNFTLQNVNAGSGSFSPSSTSATLGGFVYYAGEATTTIGRELYRSSSGLPAPALVADINSAANADSNPSNFLSTEGTTMSATNLLFFTATTTANGTELYRVTNAGAVSEVANININPGTSSSPSSLTILGTNLYFACNDGTIGSEIYRTNGNVGDKLAVTNINPGIADASPAFLTAVNGKLVFRATDGTSGLEPWVLDPVSLVSTRLKDINASGDSAPSNFTLVGSTVYFTAGNPTVSGTELYKTDGTVAGTVLVKDIFPGVTSSSPTNLKNVNGTLYFRATNVDGVFLMKSNGTAAGTIVATSSGVTYQEPANINHLSTPASTVNNVYFTAKTNSTGTELLFVKAEPPVQPTGLNLTRTASSISGTFTASSTGSPTGYLVVRNAINAPDGLPVDGPTAYVAGNSLIGTGTVVQQANSLTFNDNSLSANTTYFYKIFAYYNDGVSFIYQPNSALSGSATTFSAEPTVQTVVSAVSSITQTSMIVSWTSNATPGVGTERIVLAQLSTAVTGIPVDGTTYSANSNFSGGGASSIGGAKVVYKGSGSTVTVTGLTAGQTYHFRAYELNGTVAQTNFLTTQPVGAATSGTTLAVNNNQPTNLSFPAINPTSMTLAWDAAAAGLAEGYLVTYKLGGDPDANPPSNAVQYTAGSAIGGGTFVGFVDAAENLTGSVTGLTAGSIYFFRIYAYTTSDVSPSYVLTGPLAGVQATLDTEPASGPAGLSLHTPTPTSLSGTISAGAGSPAASAYLVLEKSGAAVSPDAPTDGTFYVVGATIGASRVVHVGVGLSFTSSDLDPNTTYHYSAFALRGTGVTANYNLTPATSNRITLVEDPFDQPSNIVFSNPTSIAVDVSFTAAPTAPDGGYVVVRRQGSPVAIPNIPADGTSYTAGNSLGASTVIAYVGTETSFHDTGLLPNTTYHYAAASFNGSGSTTNYLLAGNPTGNVTTLTSEPTGQPTALVFSNRTSTSVDISFTAAAGPPTGYIVQRISAPTLAESPVDGEAYTAGQLHGIDVVAFFGSGTSFTDNNLVEGTQYHYAVFAFNGSTGTYNYLSTSPLEGSVFTLAETPTDQPTNLVFSNPTVTSIDLDFDDGANIPAGYVVLRKQDSAPTEVPVDGTTYTSGTALVTSTVAFVGTATQFTDAGLNPNKIYHYTIFSFNGAGTYTTYLTASPLAGSRTTLNNEPTSQPTAISFTNTVDVSASVGFTPSAAPGYLILAKPGATPPTEVPVDGTTYANGGSLGSATTFVVNIAGIPLVQTGLTPGTEYSYAIFAFSGFSGANNYLTSAPLTGTVTTTSTTPANQPTALSFSSVAATSVAVSFTPPATAPTGYLVLRKAGSIPTGVPVNRTGYSVGNTIGDGAVVHAGASASFTDSGLTAQTTYHYLVFSFNGSGSSSAYLTSSPLTGSQATLNAEPSAQPTALSFTAVTSTSLSVGFTASSAPNYLILRTAGPNVPPELPVDGVQYTNGSTLGTSTAFTIATAGIPHAETGLTAATQYSYAVYALSGSGAASNYLTTAPLTGTMTTLAAAPAAQPTAVSFTSVATENVTVSWTAPATAPAGYLVLRKLGSAPTGMPANATAYTAGNSIGDGVVAFIGAALNFIDTGLIGESEYYYQVFSFNGSGTTSNYLTTSPASGHQLLFAWEPSNQPTVLKFTNITSTGFTVGFTPNPDDFASGHIVIRKTGAAPTGVPVDGTTYTVGAALGDGTVAYVGPAASFNETLAPAPHNYAVFAYNGDIGAATNYNALSPLTGTLTLDSTPPSFANSTTATIGSGLPLKISAQVTDAESGISGTVTLEFRPLTATSTSFTSRDMALVSGKYEATLTGEEIGELGVVFRMKAANGQGVAGTSSNFRTLVSFATLALPAIDAGDGVEDYRIIAIPLQLSSSNGAQVFAALGESDKGKNWRMFHYSNGSTTEIDNLSSLTVAPGKGYWLISKTSKVIQPGSGNAVDVTETSPFTISLTRGWNQIGNPYLFNILLSDINAANGTNLQLKTYHGGFTPTTKLEKFEGGFVEVGDPISLKIPTAKNPAAGREGTIEAKTNPIGSDDWEVVINLNNGDSKNPFGGLGMSARAKVGYDDLDDFTLPRFFKYVELNHNKQIYGMTYTKDILPVADSHTWAFAVESNESRTTEMTWDNSYFGNNDLQLVLWDEEEQKAIDMRRNGSYTFNQGLSRKFQIFFGNQAYIDENVEANRLRLHSIYPNPSGSDVTVTFSLPGKESSYVQVRVVNSLGQHVANIFEGQLEAGYHEVAWSGRKASGERPADGVYVVEVISGELRESKRLVIK